MAKRRILDIPIPFVFPFLFLFLTFFALIYPVFVIVGSDGSRINVGKQNGM